jgi:hypothetical protein
VREVTSGGSYLTTSETVAEIAFSPGDAPEAIEVRWPSGLRQRLSSPPVGRRLDWPAPRP